MGDVVEEADGDPALDGGEERGEHEPAGVGLEAHVVHGEVEALLRLREEAGQQACDVGGALAAVGERGQLDGRVGPVMPSPRSAEAVARRAAVPGESCRGDLPDGGREAAAATERNAVDGVAAAGPSRRVP